MTRSIYFFAFVLFVLSFHCSQAQEDNKPRADKSASGFLDFNGYYDSRERSEATLNILANSPSKRFQYFSLTNVTGQQDNGDLSGLFSEQNLRWKLSSSSPWYINYQSVIRGGPDNDAARIGLRCIVDQTKIVKQLIKGLPIKYAVATFLAEAAYQTHVRWFTQLEHVYRIGLIKNILYLAGFADQNMRIENDALKIDWVTEHQLGFMLYDNFYLVTEYRINEYLAQSTGWGFGLEYKMIF